MVSIHRPSGYEPNTLPLRQDASEPFYIMLGIKAPIGFEPMYSGFCDHPLYHLRIELKIIRHCQVSILGPLDYETNALPLRHNAYEPFYILFRIKAHAGTAPAPPVYGLWLTGVLLLYYIYIYKKTPMDCKKIKRTARF